MFLSLKIAIRYLFSKKSHTAINAVSIVSVCGVAIATMAMICTLSVYNGFEEIISSLYSEIDPHLEVRAKTGKTLDTTAPEVKRLTEIKGIEAVTSVVEDNALAVYGNKQQPVVIKGVPANYSSVNNIDDALLDGETMFADSLPYAVIGVGISNTLMVAPHFLSPIYLYAPKRKAKVNLINPSTSFNTRQVYCSGVFSISQAESDNKFVYVPIEVAKQLFDYTTEATLLEIKVTDEQNVGEVQKEVQNILGEEYVVKDRIEQKSEAFSMMAIEKWITFFMLLFVLVISTFNIIASVSMLIIDKKENIKTLHNLGSKESFITKIFFNQGVLISFIGAVIGVLLGLALSLMQQHLGILKMGANFIVEYYPVKVIWSDVLLVVAVVVAIGVLIAWIPVKYINSKLIKNS
ncbi:MAG: FtsX-like permease family protein [Bacteroidales bacterium]|nr:FtsX-like permease family protein [Bacteroidales bacterium]